MSHDFTSFKEFQQDANITSFKTPPKVLLWLKAGPKTVQWNGAMMLWLGFFVGITDIAEFG